MKNDWFDDLDELDDDVLQHGAGNGKKYIKKLVIFVAAAIAVAVSIFFIKIYRRMLY